MFANMYMAYDALSPKLKELLDPLEAVHVSEEIVVEAPKYISRSSKAFQNKGPFIESCALIPRPAAKPCT